MQSQARSLWEGYRDSRDASATAASSAYGSASAGGPELREPGARRRKLAAIAGSVYRAGAAAAAEVREQYNNTRIRNVDNSVDPHMSIPGSFPNVAIVSRGEEQMVLFPSYAKRHIRQFDRDGKPIRSNPLQQPLQQQQQQGQGQYQASPALAQAQMTDEEYWHHEWVRLEDEKAVVDVDVRGWIYSPHKGPMNRKNRMLIGLARRLSGIPPPTIPDNGGQTQHEQHEEMREQQRIAREAEEIERRGQREKEAANRGRYSEMPSSGRASGSATPAVSPPSSPTLSARSATTSVNTAAGSELTEAELAVANANLMARLGPFLTTPLVQLPITVFFYNDKQSQSKTVTTNDAGHFNLRAALDFVPTHIRVLANENLSAVEPVEIIENVGVSLISDIDDTVKRSNISLGAREIFRNTFIRDLGDMCVEGIREWYTAMHEMGVQIHYCSNSPWQLFPVLATFFHGAGLPPGSLHLKQYSGMLQGIFEPVAERKKGTLDRILSDFPERRFLLVGDSGEADLEVYTELAQANPGRILAIFIRDVTTPEQQLPALPGFFDSSLAATAADDRPSKRPILPPRVASVPAPASNSIGDLIDLSDEPAHTTTTTKFSSEVQSLAGLRIGEPPPRSNTTSAAAAASPDPATSASGGGRKMPPARPAKPASLRSAPSDASSKLNNTATTTITHPLAQIQNASSQQTLVLPNSHNNHADAPSPLTRRTTVPASLTSRSSSSSFSSSVPPPPPPPRRGGAKASTPTSSSMRSVSPGLLIQTATSQAATHAGNTNNTYNNTYRRPSNPNNTNANSDVDSSSFEGLPPPSTAPPTFSSPGTGTNTGAVTPPVNKKVDLWHRRLERAQDTLLQCGVRLYTWRKGEDVVLESTGIVREALRGMGVDLGLGHGDGGRKGGWGRR